MTSVFPSLRYRDARRAIDWLEKAFDFKATAVHEDGDGNIAHAELLFGSDGMVMLGPDRDDDWFGPHAGKAWLYVVVEDADSHYAQAKAAGAEIVRELEDQDYGSRDYSARDFEGNLWSFGTYRPEIG
jgi:uncharacterized glyoxalase superfamily protein PhnB